MTSKEGSWQVVGKPKSRNPQQILNKERKTWLDNNFNRDPLADNTGSMFDAFIKKTTNEETTKVPSATTATVATSKIPTPNGRKIVAEKKKKPATPPAPPKKKHKMSFDEAANKIQRKKLDEILTDCQLRFPESREVWMKDIASYLGLAMDTVPDPDPVYKSRSSGFPLSEIPVNCQTFLHDLMSSTDRDTLSRLFSFCVNVIISEVSKGHPAHGYRIFLQSIASHRPEIIDSKKQHYIELIKANHHKPSVCLSILWSVGLCGLNDMRRALKLWLEVMVQFITVKPLAHYVVLYLERLLRGDLSQAYGVMTYHNFFPLMDVMFSTTPDVQSELKIKLVAQYEKLKQISIKGEPDKSLHLFFPSFLRRLTPSCTGALKAELISSLIHCLSVDPQTYSVWTEIYVNHLSQSAVLLSHIEEKWPRIKRELGDKFMATIQAFHVTNENTVNKKNVECSRICESLLKRPTRRRMTGLTSCSWLWLLPVVISLLAGVIAYDILMAKSFHTSRTVVFMDEYGILAFTNQVYTKTRNYTLIAAQWLQVNVPVYCELAYTTIVPYVHTAIQKTKESGIYMEEVSRPHRAWIITKAYELQLMIYNLSPEFWDNLPSYIWLCIDTVRDYLLLLWHYTLIGAQRMGDWINTNIMTAETGTVGEVMSNVRTTIHTQMLRTYEWCSSVVASWN